MNKIQNWLLAIAVVVGLQSCDLDPCGSTPDNFLTKLERLVDQIAEKKESTSDEDWSMFDEQFEKLASECYEQHDEQMTVEQQKRFLGLSTRYAYLRGSGGLKNFFRNSGGEINKIREELKKLDTKEFQDLMNDVGEDMEDIGKKIEDFFKD